VIGAEIMCAIGAEIARVTVGGAAEERADERHEDRGGRDARDAEAGGFETPPSAAWQRREVDARPLDELRDRRDPSPGAREIDAEMASEISPRCAWTVGGAAEQRAYERGEDRAG
jgi:hypothetical protein